MLRQPLLKIIDHAEHIESTDVLRLFREFILLHPHCFERNNRLGHVTASAFIFNEEMDKVLLMHHKKLKRWMQMGGHCDGHHLVNEVAYREACEETGLQDLTFATPFPIDFDIHLIPQWKEESPHLHFDVRYLMIASEKESFKNAEAESHALRWVPLSEVSAFTQEISILRVIQKSRHLRNDHSMIHQ